MRVSGVRGQVGHGHTAASSPMKGGTDPPPRSIRAHNRLFPVLEAFNRDGYLIAPACWPIPRGSVPVDPHETRLPAVRRTSLGGFPIDPVETRPGSLFGFETTLVLETRPVNYVLGRLSTGSESQDWMGITT